MDESDEILDQEANLFYENVRSFVVVFLTVSALLPLSYVLIESRRKCKDPYLFKDDVCVRSFVMGICTTTISLSVIMVFMLPLSILANEVLILFPDSHYIQWINAGLLRTFFVFVRMAFKGTCVLVPFGFFFLASHSVYKGSKAVSSRLFYSALYLAVTYTASFGVLTTLASTFVLVLDHQKFFSVQTLAEDVLSRSCFNPSLFYYSWPLKAFGDLICYIDSALTFVQQFVSYTGLGLLLICIPSGIRSIIIQMVHVSAVHPSHASSSNVQTVQVLDTMYCHNLEKCLKYIESLNEPLRQSFDPNYLIRSHQFSAWLSNESLDTSSLCRDLKQTSPKTKLFLLPSFAFLVLLSVLLAAALYASINVVVLLYQILIFRSYELADHTSMDTIILGRESVSKFGFIGAGLQALMVAFVICTSLIGFYSLSLIYKHIYPRAHGASMAILLFNATCILSMSSAVPLQASLLGLATPSFPPVYYSPLNDGFCRSRNDPCSQPSSSAPLFSYSTHYLDDFQSDDLKDRPQLPHDRSLHQQQDHSRVLAFWTKQQHQHHLHALPPSSLPQTRGMAMVLLYNLGFISICWWLFRLHARDLVKVKEQLASAWIVSVQWWLGVAPSRLTSR